MVIGDLSLDTERLLFQGIDTSEGPHYSIGEVTKTFFARGPQWLRNQENIGNFAVDGEEQLTVVRREGKFARDFLLSDVELIAHALAYNQVITGRKLRSIVTILRSIGEIWGFL